MAERMVRRLVDDLDGTEIVDGKGEQIEFAVRGISYRIDLSNANITKFDKALAPFVEAATKVTAARGRSSELDAVWPKQAAAVREWAARNGYKVGGRGRIPGDVIDAYEAAHRR